MGVTVAYRGRLADLTRVEEFEDRLIDFALEFGGLGRIWRSHPDNDPDRTIRGVILDLAPGLESTSMLLSPEGWLVGLTDIEDAEEGRLTEPSWCFTKTQFGPIRAHVALVEMLRALKSEFLRDLEVSDDGGYWETRDVAALAQNLAATQAVIDGLATGLQRYGLSHEAAEDPNILLRHVERVAEQVHRILRRPPEHPPLQFDASDEIDGTVEPEVAEKSWDEHFKHNRRQQERLLRAIEERRALGDDLESAFRAALRDVAPEQSDEELEQSHELWSENHSLSFDEDTEDAESLLETALSSDEQDDVLGANALERHPLLQRATDLMVRLDALVSDPSATPAGAVSTLCSGVGEMMGGLAQALSDRLGGGEGYGLCIVQLKRALRGAAFARGALILLRSKISTEIYDALSRELEQMESDIFSELTRARSEFGP